MYFYQLQQEPCYICLLYTSKLTIDDLAKGDDLFFAATGITEGNLLKGVVNIGGNKARTESVVMRGRTGTIRRCV